MKRSKNVFRTFVSIILIFTLSVPTFAAVKTCELETFNYYKNTVYCPFRVEKLYYADNIKVEISTDKSFPAKQTTVLEVKGKKRLKGKYSWVKTTQGHDPRSVKLYEINAKYNRHLFTYEHGTDRNFKNDTYNVTSWLYWKENKKRLPSQVRMNSSKNGTECLTSGTLLFQSKQEYKKNQDVYLRIKLYKGSKLVAKSKKVKLFWSKYNIKSIMANDIEKIKYPKWSEFYTIPTIIE